MEERFHAVGLGGWRIPKVGGFVVGGIWCAALENSMEGEVQERTRCGGFDIWILLEIPVMVENSRLAMLEKNL